jgi:predicted nucleotidyltransferase
MAMLDINPEHEAIVRAILAQHVPPGVSVAVFGSRATGKARRYSDLDLALQGGGPLPPSLLADLAEAFDESELPWKVDLLDWAAANEGFRKIVDQDRVIMIAAWEAERRDDGFENGAH